MCVKEKFGHPPPIYYVNSLLDIFEENQIGMHIGTIFCGIPTVADDVTLISNDPHELQTMLDIHSHHSNKLRYQISEQKSVILVFNDNDSNTWYLNGKPMSTVSNSSHLGIERDNQSAT